MLIYGLMKYIEKIPLRYDKMMNVLTFGNHFKAHEIMLSKIDPGMTVLDIGCGTGDLSIRCARAGAKVFAVDASAEMLRVFRKKIAGTCEEQNIQIFECGSASIKEILKGMKFDVIIMSMMLGELPAMVRRETLKASSEMLSGNGFILISDELWPANALMSLIYHFLFWIFFIPNFILTRTLIMPVKNLSGDILKCSLKIVEKRSLWGGVISVLKLKKVV